ncbi:hypothetical protein M0802_002296, partial [Mischocyttarus mexicanus]
RKCVCTSNDCKEAGETICETKYSCYTELIPRSETNVHIKNNDLKNFIYHTRGCTQNPTPLLCETKSWVKRSEKGSFLSSTFSSSVFDNEDKKKNDIIENQRSLSSTPWVQISWPIVLKCCDDQDYCNSDYLGHESKLTGEVGKDIGEKEVNKIEKEEEEEEELGVKGDKREGFLINKMNLNDNITYQNDGFNRPNGRIALYDQAPSIESDIRSFNYSSSRDRIISINSDSETTTINESTNNDDDFFQHQIRPLHIAAVILAISALISVFAACYVITRLLKINTYITGDTE